MTTQGRLSVKDIVINALLTLFIIAAFVAFIFTGTVGTVGGAGR